MARNQISPETRTARKFSKQLVLWSTWVSNHIRSSDGLDRGCRESASNAELRSAAGFPSQCQRQEAAVSYIREVKYPFENSPNLSRLITHSRYDKSSNPTAIRFAHAVCVTWQALFVRKHKRRALDSVLFVLSHVQGCEYSVWLGLSRVN
ncbi:uncharacterized [Tachysurus ichikawai]